VVRRELRVSSLLVKFSENSLTAPWEIASAVFEYTRIRVYFSGAVIVGRSIREGVNVIEANL